jgi:deoxyribose-phosphate aldolase
MTQVESYIDIAPFIDHALLNPTATSEHLKKCCEEAERFQFATVCIYPYLVHEAAVLLQRKKPKICAVIAFPTGATTSSTKLYEAQEAAENGATELDVVINLGWLKSRQTDKLHRDIARICDETGLVVKAILEVGLLTEAEKRLAAEICMDAGVTYLKTNTGFYGGATVKDVHLLKELSKGQVGVKASGGIHTYEQAVDLIIAGATRLGTSRGPDLIRERELRDSQPDKYD